MNPARRAHRARCNGTRASSVPSDPTSTPTITLGHELVHAHHNATGTKRDGPYDSYPGQASVEPRRGACDCRAWRDVGGGARRHDPGGAGSQRGRADRKFIARRPRRRAPADILSVELARRAAVVALTGRAGGGLSLALLAFLLAIRLSWGMNMYAQNGDIQLSAEVSLTADRLVLSYRVENTGGSDIYLLNKVYKALPKAEIEQGFRLCLADRATAGSTSKRTSHRCRKDVADVAGGTLHERGARRGELHRNGGIAGAGAAVHRIQRQHAAADPQKERVVTANGVVFSIGYFVRPPGATERFEQQLGEEVVLFQNPPGVFALAMKSWRSDLSTSRFPSTHADRGRSCVSMSNPAGRQDKIALAGDPTATPARRNMP